MRNPILKEIIRTIAKIILGIAIFLVFTLIYIKCFAAEKENIHQVYNNRGNYQKDIAITILHDDKRNVTCYVAQNPRGEEISISCLKDK